MLFLDTVISEILRKRLSPHFFSLVVILTALTLKFLWLLSIPSQWTFIENDSVRYLRLSRDFGFFFFSDDFNFNSDSFYITPGYPLFLSLFNSQNFKLIIVFQFLLLATSQFILYKLVLKLTSKRIANLGLLVFVLESSSNLESFNLLTETLFNFIFILFLYFFGEQSRNNLTFFLAGILLGVGMLVRPVGQILLLPLLFIIYFKSHRKQILLTLIFALTVASSWIIRNHIAFDVPQLSGIQSLNLLQYEGAGSMAIESSQSLAKVQLAESELELSKLGGSASISEIVQYRTTRGISLILNNPQGFFILHLQGACKILFGPGNANLKKLTQHLDYSEFLIFFYATVSVLLRIVVTISVLFFVYTAAKRRRGLSPIQLYSIASWILILISSGGANAYSRFRVPLIPLEILVISLGIHGLREGSWVKRIFSSKLRWMSQ